MGNNLYNGLNLPDINEVWTDKESRPYALIDMLDSSTYALYIAESYKYSDYSDSTGHLYLVLNNYVRYTCVGGAQAWDGELALSQVTFLLKRTDGGNISILLWSNFNIEYGGTLYLAASDPLPLTITDPLSFMVGYNLGCRLRAQRGSEVKRKIAAYLYNGVKLPPLPEYDATAYPYAIICPINSTSYQLFVFSEKPFADDDAGLNISARWGSCDTLLKEYVWSDLAYSESDYSGAWSPIWSNFDFCHEDGTIICAESEPVKSEWDYVIATLYDGDATTADNGSGIYVSDNLTSENAASIKKSNAYRVTIDGITTILDVGGSSGNYYLGNPHLCYDSEEDNGGSWFLRAGYVYSTKSYYYLLYTREPGTYKVKLESVRD